MHRRSRIENYETKALYCGSSSLKQSFHIITHHTETIVHYSSFPTSLDIGHDVVAEAEAENVKCEMVLSSVIRNRNRLLDLAGNFLEK